MGLTLTMEYADSTEQYNNEDWAGSEDQDWVCACGRHMDEGIHCPDCGREPPWGCPCEDCANHSSLDLDILI